MLRRNFSLIELLIVIGIMGALAALILPSFNNVEADAKDTACDYNQAGTLRYLNLFRSANGVYPTGFHTGYEAKGQPVLLQLAGTTYDATGNTNSGNDPDASALTTCGTHNFGKGSTSTLLTANMIASLEGAGIVSLAYGRNIAERIDGKCNVAVVNDKETADSYWTEELDPATGAVNGSGAPLEYHNAALWKIAKVGTLDGGKLDTLRTTYGAALNCRKYTINETNLVWDEGEFVIVPLYVAPTVDWEHYYSDGPNDSKISIALAGKCPWGEGGQARYYIAFFKVFTEDNAEPAKLLCTSCPDCGILEGDLL